MKLYYSNTSPYARKVRLMIIESKLKQTVEFELVNPFSGSNKLEQANPLNKIPTLITDQNISLYDSPIICQYIHQMSQSGLIPNTDSDLYWSTLKWEALADGLTDATYNLVMEQRRPETEQSPKWKDNWSKEIKQCLEHIENEIINLDSKLSLAHLALASAIGYLKFRTVEFINPENNYPKINQWFENIKVRPSMQSTQPFD